MKQFTEYISESTTSPALALSNDEIKNSIYKSLVDSKAKFVFKIKDVDSLLDKVDPTASGKKVDCWMRERRYYGMKSVVKLLKSFSI